MSTRALVLLIVLIPGVSSLALACGGREPSSTTDTDAPGEAGSASTDASGGTGTGSGTSGETGDPAIEVPSGRPAGVFGGGPFYHDAATVMPRIRASGFDTVIVWSVHVHADGDLVLNDQLIVEDGAYVGDPDWPAQVVSLEQAPTSVVRTELSVGAWGVPDFDNIAALIEAEGTGPDSVLRRNFAALKTAMPTIDAINYDDETFHQPNPTIALSLMLAELGYKISFAPYDNIAFWVTVFDYLESVEPGLVDRVLVQVYAGGATNDPALWSAAFDGLEVEAGLWSLHGDACSQGDTPAEVQAKLEGWADATAGGWLWLLDDLLACDAQAPLEDYAAVIDAVYGG